MARRINVRQLEAFRAVMLSGNTVHAATVLALSQPSVSRLISELEAHLNAPLFVRTHGRLQPTDEAEWLFRQSETVLSDLDKLDTAARDIRHRSAGELRIVAAPPLAYALAADSIKRFRTLHCNMRVSLQIALRRETRTWIDAQQFDVALMTLPIDYPKAHTEKLARVRAVCILPPDHRLVRQKIIRAADLADEPFISALPETFTRFRLDRFFEELGVHRTTLDIETQTSLTMCQMVAAGLGVAIVEPFTAHTFASLGIAIRPFLPAFEIEYGILFPIQRPSSRLAQAFAGIVREVMAEQQKHGARKPAVIPRVRSRRTKPAAIDRVG